MEEKTYELALVKAFPPVDSGLQPFGSRVLVQMRTPVTRTKSGIILDPGTQDTEKWNTQVAKVIAFGPLAFMNRDNMKLWPEGSWCGVGDFIRVPKYGGDRWEVSYVNDDGEEQTAIFVIFNDLDLLGRVTGDPLSVKAFI